MLSRNPNLQDFARFCRYPSLDGLEVMSARWIMHSFRPHANDFYAVSLDYRGVGAIDCRGASRDASPGTCNLIAPGELHTGHATCDVGWIYRNLYIEPILMNKLLRALDYRGSFDLRFRAPVARDQMLAGRLTNVFASLEARGSLLENDSLLLDVVARLIPDHLLPAHELRDTGREHAAVNRVRDWLDAHSEENVSIHTLANLADLSPYYLIRAFHQQVGIPPHRYQIIVRVNRARSLLRAGGAISEVAYEAGFCDQSHLNRYFKQILGVTPGIYLKS